MVIIIAVMTMLKDVIEAVLAITYSFVIKISFTEAFYSALEVLIFTID